MPRRRRLVVVSTASGSRQVGWRRGQRGALQIGRIGGRGAARGARRASGARGESRVAADTPATVLAGPPSHPCDRVGLVGWGCAPARHRDFFFFFEHCGVAASPLAHVPWRPRLVPPIEKWCPSLGARAA